MHIVPWVLLALQAAIVIASLLGYGIFTSRPDLLIQVDPQARFFTWAFHGFAVGNMLFGGIAVVADAILRNRIPALFAFIAVYVASLASELLGTGLGYSIRSLFLHQFIGSQVVRSRSASDSPKLVHRELGLLGDRAAAHVECGGNSTWHVSARGLGLAARPCHEQGHQLLGVGRSGKLLRHAVEQSLRMGRNRFGAVCNLK